MNFESTFKALKPDNFAFYLLQIASFDGCIKYSVPGFVLLCFSPKMRKNLKIE